MTNTIQKIKVENMESPRSGQPVANQFIITTPEGKYFQSYSTIIAFAKMGDYGYKITLDADSWDYSITTLKYLNQFLGGYNNKKEILKHIKSGKYILSHLN